MTRINLFSRAQTKLKGVFNLKATYFHAHRWLEDQKYDVIESKYDERAHPSGKEYRIIWKADKEIDTYTSFNLEIIFNIRNIKDVEVSAGGEKSVMQKGEFNMRTTAWLLTDYEGKWDKKPFFRFMKGFYEKYLYRDSIDRLKTEMWDEGWNYVNEVKAYLHLHKFIRGEPIMNA